MTAEKLILHVGLPKTGTTTLQVWLAGNSAQLSTAGIWYPDTKNALEPKHTYLVNELRSGNLQQLEQTLSQPECSTLILSNEGLTNHFIDFKPEALEQFRTVTSHMEVQIVLVTRQKDPWVRSFYKQCVINPPNRASELWGTCASLEEIYENPRIVLMTDHDRLEHELREGFGASHVTRLDYEDSAWFTEFLQAIGIEHRGRELSEMRNVSLPEWVIEFVLHLNRKELSMSERQLWFAALQAHIGSTNNIFLGAAQQSEGRSFRELDEKLVDELLARSDTLDDRSALVDDFAVFCEFVRTGRRDDLQFG